MAHLVLVRHGTSEWNKLGKWTGLADVELAPEGVEEARQMGFAINDIHLDHAHVSTLKRAQKTLGEIQQTLGSPLKRVSVDAALNERDYGIHTGKDKWQVRDELGEEAFHSIRRGWAADVEGGENLRDVYARVIPYFDVHILPELRASKNILVVAHGNSLRALVKKLDRISDEDIAMLEIGFGEVYCYEFDTNGNVLSKEIRATHQQKKML